MKAQVPLPSGTATVVGIQSMGPGVITSEHEVTLWSAGTPRTAVDLDLGTGLTVVRQSVPKQLWNDLPVPATPSADVLPHRVVGLSGLRPMLTAAAPITTYPLSRFDLTRIPGDRISNLVPGPAVRAGPGPELASEAAIFATIAETVGEPARVVRDAVIDEARSRGFLQDDVTVDQSVLASGAGVVSELLASAPMLGADTSLGGPATRATTTVAPTPPAGVDLTVPAPSRRLVVELLALVSTRRYVGDDGVSTPVSAGSVSTGSGDRHLVLDAEPSVGAAAPSLERTLSAGAGAVFKLRSGAVDLDVDPASAGMPSTRLEIDAGAAADGVNDRPEGGDPLELRVVEIGRYGDLLRDGVRSASTDLLPDAARVVVTAGVAASPGGPHASGWHGSSLLLRVAPRTFLADGGLVVTAADGSDEVVTLRGAAMVRTNADSSARPGWTTTTLPAGTRTVAVVLRRHGAAKEPTEASAGLEVELLDGDGRVVRRLVHRHVVRDGETDVALLYRVPGTPDDRPSGRVAVRVRVPGRPAWTLHGVLGFGLEPALVRRDWTPGATGLAAPTAAPVARRTIRLVRADVARGAA